MTGARQSQRSIMPKFVRKEPKNMCTEDMEDMRVYNSKDSVRACKSSSVFDDISLYKESVDGEASVGRAVAASGIS